MQTIENGAPTLLAYGEDEGVLRDACRQVIEGEMSRAWVRRYLDSETGWDRSVWATLVELGWPGVAVPETCGGAGMGFAGLGLLAEELGRAVHSTPLLDHALASYLLAEIERPQRSAQLLEHLLDGGAIASVSLDVDGSAGQVTADRTRPGRLLLRGERAFVAHAADASVLLIDVVLDGSTALVAVDLHATDHEMRPMTTIDLARKRYVVSWHDAELPDAAVVTSTPGEIDWLVAAAMAAQCSETIGAARWLVETAVEYAKQRKQFDQVIGSFQAIKHRLADMRIRLESSVVATRYAVSAVGHRRADCRRASTVAAHWVGGSASWIASEALQVLGGVGFTWEHDLHLFMRRVKANELLLGSPDFHARTLGAWCLENGRRLSRGSG